MVSYLSKKVEELLDTLLEPLWQRVLRASVMTRLLVLGLGAAIAFFAANPDGLRSLATDGYYLSRGMFRDSEHLKLRREIDAQLQASTGRLTRVVENDLTQLERGLNTPWSAAQAALALAGAVEIDGQRLAAFVRAKRDPTCDCWVEIPASTNDHCVFISGWILAALAEGGVAATAGELEFLLKEQREIGWWPTFPVTGESTSASTYTTAWVLLGLQGQLDKGLIAPQSAQAVKIAIRKGTAWLLSTREKARWRPYPYIKSSPLSESVSGVVLHALHRTAADAVIELDGEWLDSLPERTITAGESENSYVEIATGRGVSIDHFVQIKLPWVLAATVDAFPNGTRLQRAKAQQWIENALDHESTVAADTVQSNWWRSELLYALRHTSKAARTAS